MAREAAVGIEALLAMLDRNGRLMREHRIAGTELIRCLRTNAGQSYGVSSYGLGTGGGGGDMPYVLGLEKLRSEGILSKLREHERETLNFMLLFRDKGPNKFTLAQFGRQNSTYEDAHQACAWATARITATLDSFSEICGLHQLRPG